MPAPANVPPFLASVLASERDDESLGSSQSILHTPAIETPNPFKDVELPPSGGSIIDDKRLSKQQKQTSIFSPKDDYEMMNSPQPTLLVPPLNFDMVCTSSHQHHQHQQRSHHHHHHQSGLSGVGSSAIYRSGFPNERNYPFLKSLHLRSILYLSTDEIRENLKDFISLNQTKIQLFHFPILVNKEPFQEMDLKIVLDALRIILDKRNHPILLHCNKGKYRVGVITALIRRLQGWNMTSIYDEYERFAGSDRIADEEFIDMFPLNQIQPDQRYTPDWYISRR